MALLFGFSNSDGRLNTVGTMVAEGVSATLTVKADQRVLTPVVTPSPAFEPTANLAPTTTPVSQPSSTRGCKSTVVTPVKMHPKTDGSGDYRNVEEALQSAPSCAPIILGQGNYHLPEALTILVDPDGFGATTEVRGTHTVIREIDGAFVACDGFDVGGGASW
jgi:hypothetical protein